MNKINAVRHKLKLFTQMNRGDQWLFVQAYMMCGGVRFAMKYLPFKILRKFMGTPGIQSPMVVDKEVYRTVARIKRIVLLAAKYTPWESKCLVRAMVVQRLLLRYEIPTTLYLGANKKKEAKKMEAHAWLRCGEWIVTGERERDEFIEVAKFSHYK